MYLLGIDIGSYSAKGVLLDADGQVVATASRAHEMRVPAPGMAEHDADEDWWGGFVSVTRQLLDKSRIDPSQIAAIGCSGIGPCMLPVDAQGHALRTAVLYGIDTRAKDEIVEMTRTYGEDFLLRHSGNALTTQAVGPKIRWLAKHQPDILKQSARIVGCPTYLVQRLTGRCVVDHYGAANYPPFYDIERCAWDFALTRDTCDPGLLPEALWTTDIAGTVSPEAAALTGLTKGTPVIVGTVDAASEAVSVGVVGHGDLMVMYGTSVFFIQIIPELHRDPRHWSAPWLFPGTWAAMGGVSTGGALTHWFRQQIAQLEDSQASFEQLAQEAANSPPGANGLIVLPYFSGERTPINDPRARGVIFGLNLRHQRSDLNRAMIEGVCHAVRHNLDMFDEVYPAKNTYAVGGGVHNATWMQSAVDISGKTQTVRKHTIGAALGDAFLAGLGVGLFTPKDIERINPVNRTLQPNAALYHKYSADHEIFLTLYQSTKHLMAMGLDSSP